MWIPVYSNEASGFSLTEMMMALFILTFGLLAAGHLLYATAGAGSLARSKGAAAIAAQNLLESLGALYKQNPSAADLSVGSHGPRQTQVANPIDGTILNLYKVDWMVEGLADPRPGKALNARLVRATVTPIQANGAENSQPGYNKILSVTTVFSSGMR